jgi:hypothetical protein
MLDILIYVGVGVEVVFVGYDVGLAMRFTFIFQSICIICASFVSELGHECSGILRFSDTNFLEYGWSLDRPALGAW